MIGDRKRFISHEWSRDPYGQVLPESPPKGIRTPNNIPWGHTMDDFYWIRRLPDSDVKPIWTRSMLDEFDENFGSELPVTRVEPRRLRPWPLLKVPNDDSRFGLVDEMCNAVKDAYPFAGFESSEKRVESPMEPTLSNGDAAPSTGESVLEGAVKLPDKRFESIDVERKASNTQSLSTGSEGVLSTPPLLTGATKTENDAPKGVHVSVILTKGDLTSEAAMSVEKCNVEGKNGGSHHLSAGSPKNVDKGDEIDTPKGSGFYCLTTNYETIQKLEERIPEEYFPDILLVNDPSSATISGFPMPDRRPCSPIVRYKRVWPKLEPFHWTPTKEERYAASASRRIATLNLSGAPRLGKGSHSVVLKAALRLPTPLTTQTGDSCVSVAAKLALINSADRELLENEGRIYDAFPGHLQESYCGYNLVDPMVHPVPVGACVPKFFGYYVPVQEGKEAARRRKTLQRIKERCRWGVRSPILLLEECGAPIEPEQLSEDERSECFSLVLRLHHADFVQNSLYTRNILRQPGPLTVRPSERSLKTPSFRIIDFGRGAFGPWYIERKLETQGGRPGPPTVPTREEMAVLKEAETAMTAKKEIAVGWHEENMKYEMRKAMRTIVVYYWL
ncbi:hypothetical protein F5146DRAFT_932026 [Armillaria mellea]|nr:hypothetical protein F5146DRAFT_932026 [Armillaria mellea]